jgi:hypothetical protein
LHKNESDNITPSGVKHRVTFQSSKEANLNGKSSTILHRRGLSIKTRSFDERISFSGRNAIYTAGI